MDDRRSFIKKAGILSGFFIGGKAMANTFEKMEELIPETNPTTFSLPALPYAYEALAPYIDRTTMEIHHQKHHQAYITNLNKALEGNEVKALSDLFPSISKSNPSIRNNAGGHYNHCFFWENLCPNTTQIMPSPSGELALAINKHFENFENFKIQFEKASMQRFGSGWTWLYQKPNGELAIGSTPNQDNPLMDNAEIKGKPILALDIWEHAYYLQYQQKRNEYVKNWWFITNWQQANIRFTQI